MCSYRRKDAEYSTQNIYWNTADRLGKNVKPNEKVARWLWYNNDNMPLFSIYDDRSNHSGYDL